MIIVIPCEAVLVKRISRWYNALPDGQMFGLRLNRGTPLCSWLVDNGLTTAGGLASLWSSDELDSGAALVDIANALGLDEAAELEQVEAELRDLVTEAQRESAKENRALASEPEWALRARGLERKRRREGEPNGTTSTWENAGKPTGSVPPPPYRARYGTCRQARTAGESDENGRQHAEKEERKRWFAELHEVLKELNAPSLKQARSSSDPERALSLQLGSGRRAATLRTRIREWRRFRIWLRERHGLAFPKDSTMILDYLADRAEEPCARNTLKGVQAGMKFVFRAAGMGEGLWTDEGLKAGYAELLAQSARTVKGGTANQAIPPTAGILAMLERTVCSSRKPLLERLLSWWMLVSSWGMLRYDDHRGLSPSEVTNTGKCWELLLDRTKTTGSDKPVRHRKVSISYSAWLEHEEWLAVGKQAWDKAAPHDRDYFLCRFSGEQGTRGEMSYVEYSARIRGILAGLRTEPYQEELGAEYAMCISPHSFRSFLPTALIGAGAPTEDLKWLSAWQTKSGETYVRTSGEKVLQMQEQLTAIIMLNKGERDAIGEWEVVQLGKAKLEARGQAKDTVGGVLSKIRYFRAERSEKKHWEDMRDNTPEPAPTKVAEAEMEHGGYIVSISQKLGLRKLHRLGSCYRMPKRDYRYYEYLGNRMPTNVQYDSYCRSCWKDVHPAKEGQNAQQAGEDSSVNSSDESSSTE